MKSFVQIADKKTKERKSHLEAFYLKSLMDLSLGMQNFGQL
jgi:hypothetical protein